MKIQILLWVYLCFAFVIGLKEIRIQTPFAVKKGDSTKLYCLYDTEGDPLYIVKWYKSGREFYRYVPREQPSTKSFPVGNLRIKESESNATQVTLTNVDVDAAGSFSCEITVDEPTFQTAVVSGIMNVVEFDIVLLKKFQTILGTISSSNRINTAAFKEYCFQTAKLYINKHNWYNMPPSMHVILIHGHAIIDNFALPIGMMSEEAQESNHKLVKRFRDRFSRKTSRVNTNTDMFKRLLINSDPFITLSRPTSHKKHKCLSEDMENLIIIPSHTQDTDSDSHESEDESEYESEDESES